MTFVAKLIKFCHPSGFIKVKYPSEKLTFIFFFFQLNFLNALQNSTLEGPEEAWLRCSASCC